MDRIVITGKNVSVLGECKAGSVEIEASGAVIETMPENVSLADGLTATVEGKAYPSQSGDSSGSNSSNSSNSGSSSGGSGGSSSVKETGHTNEYDPKNPYAGVNVGLFHNIPITVDENTSGVATYYLPRGMDPWAPAVIVLTPDNTTAKSFSGTKTGLAWRAVADENKIAVAFLGPQDGENWNLSLSADGRDDAALLDQLYQTMRKKGTTGGLRRGRRSRSALWRALGQRFQLHLRRGCRRGPRRLPGCLGRAVCPALPRRQQKGR